MLTLRDQPGYVGINIFIAVFRDVLAIEPQKVDKDDPTRTQHVPHRKMAWRRSALPDPFHWASISSDLANTASGGICFRHWLSPSQGELR